MEAVYLNVDYYIVTVRPIPLCDDTGPVRLRRQVEDECGTIPMVLVQNKIDLIDRATIDA